MLVQGEGIYVSIQHTTYEPADDPADPGMNATMNEASEKDENEARSSFNELFLEFGLNPPKRAVLTLYVCS